MLMRVCAALAALGLAAAAADFTGTWKLNTAKSKYTGMAKPKEMTVVYTPQGTGWSYEAKGTSADGQPMGMSFVYAKDGQDIAVTGSPLGDTIVIKNANGDVSTGVFKRGGKTIGQFKRTLSNAGKTIVVEGNTILPDGTRASYTSVYDKK